MNPSKSRVKCQVTIAPDLNDKLTEEAKRLYVSRSSLIDKALRLYFQHEQELRNTL